MTAATILREIRVVRLPRATIPLGAYATTGIKHDFAQDGHAGSMCLACFGWRDDPRHPFPRRRA